MQYLRQEITNVPAAGLKLVCQSKVESQANNKKP